MTKADRLCIAVALLPVTAYLVGLFGFMLVRQATGSSLLPEGTAMVLPAITLIVTIAAVGTAHLLRIKLARAPK